MDSLSATAPSELDFTTPLMPSQQCLSDDNDDSLVSTSHQSSSVRLYDPYMTLEISRDLADGFLILLSGGLKSASAMKKTRRGKRSKESKAPGGESSSQTAGEDTESSSIHLAFAALTEGSVIDATFGVQTCGGARRSKETSQQAFDAAKAAKEALLDATDASDAIYALAVEAYGNCFEAVIRYHDQIAELGLISWCMKHQLIRREAEEDLRLAFETLNEAVAAAF